MVNLNKAADRVGFIGVGNMGGGMATRLLKAGILVTVCDPNPANIARLGAPGAVIAATPRAVADASEIVFASLPSLKASEEVAFGADGITKGKSVKIYVEMSTLGSAPIESIAVRLSPTGIGFLDSPVSAPGGGVFGARDNVLVTMVAGARATFDRVQPFLAVIARHVFYLGETPGQAQIAKLINNLLSKAGEVAAFEGVALGIKAGLDPKALIDVVNVSSGRNTATMEKFPDKILPRRFIEHSSLRNTMKDIESFLAEAKRFAVPLWIAPHVLEVFYEARDHGYMEYDNSRVFEYVEKLAGIEGRRP